MRELNIMMFGPRYVGKTSLLTAMYYEYEQEIAKTRIQLKPDLDTAYDLGKKLAQLKSLNDEEDGIESTEAKVGAKSIRSFIFDLGQKGTKPSLRLHFWDYPGGYVIDKDKDEDGRNAVKKCLTESVCVVIAIDTPALMEAKERGLNNLQF